MHSYHGSTCQSTLASKRVQLLTRECCNRYAGKAAYYTGDYKRAKEEYRAAIDLDGDSLGAWEGLAECQLAAREGDAAVETFEHLVSMGISIMTLQG